MTRCAFSITGSSGQIGTNLGLRLLRDGHEVFGVDKRQNPWTRRVPDAAAGSCRPLPGVRGRHRRRRVPASRRRRAPRRARQGAPARPRAAPRARERDHDLQRPRVRARSSACRSSSRRRARCTATCTGSRSTPRRQPTSPTPRARTRRRRSPARRSSTRTPAATGSTTSSSASRTSTAATTTTSGGWSACCRCSRTSWRAREPITIFGGDDKVLDFTYIDDCVDGIARGVYALVERPRHEQDDQPRLRRGQHARAGRGADRARARRRADITMAPSLLGEVTHYVADVTEGARAARLGAVDAARRRHPAVGRLVPRVARRPSRGGTAVRASARRRPRSTMATSSRPAPAPSTSSRSSGRPRPARPPSPGCSASGSAPRSISADSAALYAGLPILTAAPPYPARLVGIVPLDGVDVGRRVPAARPRGDRRRPRSGRLPLVVGGTGLYLRAALAELELPPAAAPGGARFWESEYDRLGAGAAHALLAARDPAAAARVHPNDRKRVVRALELAEAGASLAPASDQLWSGDTRLPTTDRRARRSARRARPPDRGAHRRDGRARRRRGGARRVVAGRFRATAAHGARARGVRDASASTRRSTGSTAGDAAPRALPAQVAAPHAGRRYPRRRPACRGDRR